MSDEAFADLLAAVSAGDGETPTRAAVLLGDQGDEVRLRWLLITDGAWSDEDCLWATAGGAQIDSIAVTFDQGAGEQPAGWVETCESGVPLQWVPTITRGVGDYAQIWPVLADLDPGDDSHRTFRSELAWRDFYADFLLHRP